MTFDSQVSFNLLLNNKFNCLQVIEIRMASYIPSSSSGLEADSDKENEMDVGVNFDLPDDADQTKKRAKTQ